MELTIIRFLASIVAGVSLIISRGFDIITAKADRQISFLIKEMEKKPGITIYNDYPSLPIVTFNISGMENDD